MSSKVTDTRQHNSREGIEIINNFLATVRTCGSSNVVGAFLLFLGRGIKQYTPYTLTEVSSQHNARIQDELPPKCKSMTLTRLFLVGRRSGVVLVAPDPVPESRHAKGENEDNGSVVDRRGRHGDDRGHAE